MRQEYYDPAKSAVISEHGAPVSPLHHQPLDNVESEGGGASLDPLHISFLISPRLTRFRLVQQTHNHKNVIYDHFLSADHHQFRDADCVYFPKVEELTKRVNRYFSPNGLVTLGFRTPCIYTSQVSIRGNSGGVVVSRAQQRLADWYLSSITFIIGFPKSNLYFHTNFCGCSSGGCLCKTAIQPTQFWFDIMGPNVD